jgi:hypothetical protein
MNDGLSGSTFSTSSEPFDVVVKKHTLNRPLSSPQFFNAILTNSGPEGKRLIRKHGFQLLLLLMAFIAFVLGGYSSYVGAKSAKLSNLQSASIARSVSNDSDSSAGGYAPK